MQTQGQICRVLVIVCLVVVVPLRAVVVEVDALQLCPISQPKRACWPVLRKKWSKDDYSVPLKSILQYPRNKKKKNKRRVWPVKGRA